MTFGGTPFKMRCDTIEVSQKKVIDLPSTKTIIG